MDPEHGATTEPVTVAQITVPTGTTFQGKVSAQGRSFAGDDWEVTGMTFSNAAGGGGGGGGGKGRPPPPTPSGGAGAGAVEDRVCEGGVLTINCAGIGNGVINVLDASYGRHHGPDVCPHAATSDQGCHETMSTDIVRASCQSQVTCDVAATNGVFGDPCGGTYKYLTVNYLCNTAPTPQQAGCYDGTREGFLDIDTYPKIAACGTGYQGLNNVDVSTAGLLGNINRQDTGDPVCANGWHVCSGADINMGRNSETHYTAITLADARSFPGCFGYNANNDCHQCQDQCGSREGSGAGEGGHENDRGAGCAVSGGSDPDMVGIGADCRWQDNEYHNTPACLADGRIRMPGSMHDGCVFKPGVNPTAGLVCCRDDYGTDDSQPTCSGTFSIASDNAYALYINGEYRANVNGGRTNVEGCDTATNQFGDAYTGCNWQSVDLHYFSVNGPFVIAVDALDAGGTGGWVGTAIVNGVEYPTNSAWRCWNSATPDGDTGGWSQVNTGWHGDPPDTNWMSPNFVDTSWAPAFTFGANGVGPWGDVNREHGDVDDGGLGFISAASEWIWSQDKDAHNDVFCRLTVPCGGLVLFSEDFEGAGALGRWRGKQGADTPFSGTVEDGGRGGGKGLRMNQCTGGGDSYSAGTFICSVASPCLVSFWTKGRPWQGFSEQFAGPHIWTATPQDYHGMHIKTPDVR